METTFHGQNFILLIKVKEMSLISPFPRILRLRKRGYGKPREKDVSLLRKQNGLAGRKKRGSLEAKSILRKPSRRVGQSDPLMWCPRFVHRPQWNLPPYLTSQSFEQN